MNLEDLRHSATHGKKKAMFKLATLLLKKNDPDEQPEALHWLRKSAESGNRRAAHLLGLRLQKDGEHSEAAHWFFRASDKGNVKSTLQLSLMHLKGQGVEKDLERATSLCQSVAQSGDIDGILLLAFILEQGERALDVYDELRSLYRSARDRNETSSSDYLWMELATHHCPFQEPEYHDEDSDWEPFLESPREPFVVAQHDMFQIYSYFAAGLRSENGWGVEHDPIRAESCYRQSVCGGLKAPMILLARMYEEGRSAEDFRRSVSQDDLDAANWYHRAAQAGFPEAMFKLGLILQAGKGVETDPDEAARWFREAAERDHVSAMAELACALYNGSGVEKNEEESLEWRVKAARLGDVESMFSAAWDLVRGNGKESCEGEAISLCREAVEHGHVLAMTLLAWMFATGTKVDENIEEALTLWRMAANEGETTSMRNLGVVFRDGHGVTQDFEEAGFWFHEASVRGEPDAMFDLSQMLFLGQGVEEDVSEAIRWCRAAAEEGHEKAIEELRTLECE